MKTWMEPHETCVSSVIFLRAIGRGGLSASLTRDQRCTVALFQKLEVAAFICLENLALIQLSVAALDG
jgi:hypothetical protein